MTKPLSSICTKTLLLTLALLKCFTVSAQVPESYTLAETQQLLNGLPVCGTVLYVAAHPDDENTRLISYLARERHLNVYYLSLTRGDGGQNLIGSELGTGLGIIRTQELIAARKVDGGKQLFSQARDFGFSKSPEETYTIWPRDLILKNTVSIIRLVQPDVIITRFSPQPSPTHGHHTASAQLALEAFKLSGTQAYADQMAQDGTQPWQPKRIFWNISSFFFQGREKEFNPNQYQRLDIGGYNAVMGRNYQEISAESRSKHKSQGFGSGTSRGPALEYFQLLAGDTATKDILEGVNTSWRRFPSALWQVDSLVRLANGAYQQKRTERATEALATAHELLETYLAKNPAIGQPLLVEKQRQISKAITAVLGLRLEATTSTSKFVLGDYTKLNVEVTNRSAVNATLLGVRGLGADTALTHQLAYNQPWISKVNIRLPKQISIPYWLRNTGGPGHFGAISGGPWANYLPEEPNLSLVARLNVGGHNISLPVPVAYRTVDPVRGELHQPLQVLPQLEVSLPRSLVRLLGKGDSLAVTIKANADIRDVVVSATFSNSTDGKGGHVATIPVRIKRVKAGSEATVNVPFPVGKLVNRFLVTAIGRDMDSIATETVSASYPVIAYDHIPNQLAVAPAIGTALTLDTKVLSKKIAYINGAGDAVADGLRLMGYEVDIIGEKEVKSGVVNQYPAVVVGIRAYNTLPWLKAVKPQILDYVRRGGNWIVQYNTANFISGVDALDSIGPYPIKIGNQRVTVERAPVTALLPQHPVLNKPNKITDADWNDWVQERGLYFARSSDSRFQAPLSMADPGEDELKGSLLVTQYGKGHWVYTGLSFFRQLPAGVPGAYRLMNNLVELGRK